MIDTEWGEEGRGGGVFLKTIWLITSAETCNLIKTNAIKVSN